MRATGNYVVVNIFVYINYLESIPESVTITENLLLLSEKEKSFFYVFEMSVF